MGHFITLENTTTRSAVAVLTVLSTITAMKSQGLDGCATVTALISTCSSFISYGMPDPMPGTPCCDAMVTLNMMATGPTDDENLVCKCLMGLITTYTPNYSAIAALPGFCGVSLGFTVSPNTDCNKYTL